MPVQSGFGELLREQLARKSWGQTDLAVAIAGRETRGKKKGRPVLNPNTVQGWLAGSPPNPETFEELITALQREPAPLSKGEEEGLRHAAMLARCPAEVADYFEQQLADRDAALVDAINGTTQVWEAHVIYALRAVDYQHSGAARAIRRILAEGLAQPAKTVYGPDIAPGVRFLRVAARMDTWRLRQLLAAVDRMAMLIDPEGAAREIDMFDTLLRLPPAPEPLEAVEAVPDIDLGFLGD